MRASLVFLFSPNHFLFSSNQTWNVTGLFNFVKYNLEKNVSVYRYVYMPLDEIEVLIYIFNILGLSLSTISFCIRFSFPYFLNIRNRSLLICHTCNKFPLIFTCPAFIQGRFYHINVLNFHMVTFIAFFFKNFLVLY